MIRIIELIVIFIFIDFLVSGQTSVPGIPESFQIKTKNAVIIPERTLQKIDTSSLLKEDTVRGIYYRYGVVEQLNIDIKSDGIKTRIAGKGTIWQYKLSSANSKAIGISFGKYNLPAGAKVFIYNDDHSQLVGAFTELNNNGLNYLTIADFKGKNVIIEYFEPDFAAFSGQLSITSVLQAYKTSSTTRIGINCPEGINAQDLKHAVCRMTFHDNYYGYYCSGFLVNNVREDGTPYFQTANHCINTDIEASTLVTYFNYENSTCSGSDAPLSQSLSGAVIKATSNYSDFTLLLLNEYPPVSYLPYFAGWDASSRLPKTGTCIHHPMGTPKCIALNSNAPTSYAKTMQWTDENNVVVSTTSPNTHWESINTAGQTEAGSSGSPLFDDQQHVIGQLHGGTDSYDYHGKFSVSWNHNVSASAQLKTWLDPDNTGILTLDGMFPKMKPKAGFSVALNQICKGSTIQLANASKYAPVTWKWNIFPATYRYVNGTSNLSQNPMVSFDSIGNYSVSLVVSNANGTDSVSKTNYINVGDIAVKLAKVSSDSIVCGCNLIQLPLGASGASNYVFKVERLDKMSYTIASDSIYLSLRSTEKKYGSFNSWIYVTGTQGVCQKRDSLLLKVEMPTNDDAENALLLESGTYKSFSNRCASAETNEPYTGTASKNTLWFKFRAPSSGKINIDTHGFNDKIAVYDAASVSDLLSASRSKFTLMASNDNRSVTDNTAAINDLVVEPYKMYWLQVDGSGGTTGECTIDLTGSSLEVYPNPSDGVFNVMLFTETQGDVSIQVSSLSGQIIYEDLIPISLSNSKFTFDLSTYPAGIYILTVKTKETTFRKRLLLVKK